MLISGEPGIGKSRLLADLELRLQSQLAIRRTTASEVSSSSGTTWVCAEPSSAEGSLALTEEALTIVPLSGRSDRPSRYLPLVGIWTHADRFVR